MNRYHWFVLLVAALGWLFDTMDQQLYVLVRVDALAELLKAEPGSKIVKDAAGSATAFFLIGWATGGLIFGMLGDKIGRVKTMLATILLYSAFTGLSIYSTGFNDFCFYRFMTGLGVGGEFAVGVALVAETMPTRARPYALSILQASSGVGNILAALIYLALGRLQAVGAFAEGGFLAPLNLTPWRIAFLLGALPALLVLLIRRRLKEPEIWKQSASEKRGELGSYQLLLTHPVWSRRAIGGLLLGFSAVVGLWGIGFFISDLLKAVFQRSLAEQGLEGNELAGAVKTWVGVNAIMQNAGGMLGILAGGLLAQKIGRRPAFAIAYIASMLVTAFVFASINSTSHVFWMSPIMGFCQLAIFGLLAMYLPELFPTKLRSTGTSFCYNVGRFVAASGPLIFGVLTARVFVGADYPDEMPYRYAGVTMCVVFLIGVAALPLLPETKGKPLPE